MFFHGSKHRIKNFTDEFVGARDAVDQEGPGIYFTSLWDDARSYGPYVYTVKLNPRKKVSTQSGKNAPLREIEWLIRQAPDWEKNAKNWHENPSIGLKKAAKDFIEYNDSPHQQFMQVWYDFYRYSPKEYVRNMTKLGYDIIYIERNNGVTHAIVLNPSIIEFVEMKDDRTDEEKNKDGLKEIRKFIRKTLSEVFVDKQGVNSMVLLKKESGWVKKINETLKESYDDVGVDMVKANKKVDEYKNFTDKKIVDNYVYLHFPEKDNSDLWGKIMVFDLNDGTEVANSSYGRKNKFHTLKGAVDVRPDKRRQGIATEIYKWIEELTGEKIYLDIPHSKSAEKFWAQSNRPFGEKSLQENKSLNTQVCENCFHSWKKESSDNDPYLCHVCGYDNKKGVFRIDNLKKWQKKHYSKLNEEEQKMKKIVYEALFVDNTSKLKQMFPPVHPNVFYHHMTIAFAPNELKYPENLGQKVRLEIIGRITTDKVDALLVNSSMSLNKYPHITLSTADGVKPVESNKVFEEYPDKIKRFNSPLYIDTTYGYFDGKNKIIS